MNAAKVLRMVAEAIEEAAHPVISEEDGEVIYHVIDAHELKLQLMRMAKALEVS